jgi:hypothetical protein
VGSLIYNGPFIADVSLPGNTQQRVIPGQTYTFSDAICNTLVAEENNWWTPTNGFVPSVNTVTGPVVTVTSNYGVSAQNGLVLADATSGRRTTGSRRRATTGWAGRCCATPTSIGC